MNVRLRDSRLGRAWVAMRENETAADATGAAFGGVSGAFFGSYVGFVDAGQFEFSFSLFIFAMVVLGGLGSIRGVVVGAILLSVFNNYLLPKITVDPAFDLSETTA